jgi:hypothetical protein
MIEKPARVVNLRKDSYEIYIGRPGKGLPGFWGNPFSWRPGTPPEFRVANRAEAIRKHKEYVRSNPEIMRRLPELAGKRLGCFCRPQLCHGDGYLDLLEELGYPVCRV